MTVVLKYNPQNIDSLEIELPGSKSISNRLLILRFLSKSKLPIQGLSKANDTQVLLRCLDRIGNKGTDQIIDLDCEDGGTPLRFLMALCSVIPGSYKLHGISRLMQRPMSDLIHALLNLGADIQALGEGDCGPWRINGNPNLNSATLTVSFEKSSQFTSALLLIAPILKEGLKIELPEQKGSWPYIQMTLEALKDFKGEFISQPESIQIKNGIQAPAHIKCEADWSSAIFFYAALAILKKGTIYLKGLSLPSVQGDAFASTVFSYEGIQTNSTENGLELKYIRAEWALNPISINLSNYPDMAPALVIFYLIQGREIDFYGLESLALKESERDKVLADLVQNCGASFTRQGDVWLLRGSITKQPEIALTHQDHRMLMAFSLLALYFGQIQLEESDSVSKSFPDFWKEFAKLGLLVEG